MAHESLQNVKCPNCNGPMAPRTNKNDGTKFWGCKSYPRCNGTRDSMGMSKADKERERYERDEEE